MDAMKIIEIIEANMIREFVLSTDFDFISKGSVNKRRRWVTVMLIASLVLLVTQTAVAFFAGKESNVHWYVVNCFYGYGYLGKIWNGMYMIGVSATTAHAIVFFVSEGKGKFMVITDFKNMFQRLGRLKEGEITLIYYLRIMAHVRVLSLMTISIPMILFRGVGAAITAYEFQSWIFLVASTFSIIPFTVAQLFNGKLHCYTHLTIAHSATYFNCRLKRVEVGLKSVVSGYPNNSKKSTVSGQLNSIESKCLELKDILDEVARHNQCVKYWIWNDLLTSGCLISFCILQSISNTIAWYLKVSAFITVASWMAVLLPPLTKAANLHMSIRSLTKVLYSCQVVLQKERSKQSGGKRSTSALIAGDKGVNLLELIRTKRQIIRMIHRISPRFVKIGFTVGNGKSFSPLSILQLSSSVAFNSLMFLNSRSSVIRDLLDI